MGRWSVAGTYVVVAAGALGVAAPAASADELLVANFSSDNVSVVDTATNAMIGSPIAVGDEPVAIAITPDGSRAYVANQGSDTVSVIDVATRSTVGTPIPVQEVGAVAIGPDGTKAYVISGTFVRAIDTQTNTLTGYSVWDQLFPSGTTGIAVTPDERQVWVGHSDPNYYVNRIHTDGSGNNNPPFTLLDPGAGPKAIAFTPDGSRAYVASENGAGVIPIDTASGVASAPIQTGGDHGTSIAITPDGSRAYMPSADLASDVVALNLATNTTIQPTIVLPNGPTNLFAAAITPDGSRVYVAGGPLPDPGKVVGVSIATGEPVGPPITVGLTPIAMAIVPDRSPTARLASTAAIAGVPLSFDASASSDPDGTVARYDWSYGDGASAANAGPRPSHTYAAGTYTVRVTVTDEDGCSTATVYTGQTAYCSGSAEASASQALVVEGLKLGAVKLNSRKGTATVSVQVPAAGELTLDGKGLASQHEAPAGAGEVSLKVQPKAAAKHKLKRKGKLTVRPTITFTPAGGSAESQSLDVKLKRKGTGR